MRNGTLAGVRLRDGLGHHAAVQKLAGLPTVFESGELAPNKGPVVWSRDNANKQGKEMAGVLNTTPANFFGQQIKDRFSVYRNKIRWGHREGQTP